MKFAIIAAGEGSRLAQEGIKEPKPLIRLHGVPIIERLIGIFSQHNASGIYVIINSRQPETLEHLQKLQERFPLEIIVRDTPSSMHSLYELSPYLKGEKFCLTTVDTLFRKEEFSEFIKQFEECSNDGLMAVTDFIDDEKPLYIATDKELTITAFCDTANKETAYISGGIYGLDPKTLDILDTCIDEGIGRMRNFQRKLVENGLRLKAFPFGKIIDIDHAGDIEKARIFLAEND